MPVSMVEFAPRLLRIAVVAFVAGGAAHLVHRQLLKILFQPLGDLAGAYTVFGQPGVFFIMYISVGLIFAIPIAAYHILRAMESRYVGGSALYFMGLGLVSASLVISGIYLGYYYGLPYVLQFLPQQFLLNPAQPRDAVYEYLQFTSLYLLLSALAYQLPLVLYIANELKVRRVRDYLQHERPVLLGALIVGAALNPSDDVLAMAAVAFPILGMYQVGVLTVWAINRFNQTKFKSAGRLRNNDATMQAERLYQVEASMHIPLLEPRLITAMDNGSDPEADPSTLLPSSIADNLSMMSQPRPTALIGTNHPSEVSSALPLVAAPVSSKTLKNNNKCTTVNGIRRRMY